MGGLPGDVDNETIVRAIITMGHGLGLRVIAEGVETKEQLDFLRMEGCDEIQGHLFAPPMPAEDLTKLFYSSFGKLHLLKPGCAMRPV